MIPRAPALATVAALLLAALVLAPAAGAAEPRSAAGPSPAPTARLRLEHDDGELLAWAENPLAGPIEVMLHGDGGDVRARPALPARATVPARGRALLTRIEASAAAGIRFRLEAVPGHPSTRPRDVEYAWPLARRRVDVAQGWGGHASHDTAADRHAIDLATPVGTPVLAARDGVVMQVESGFHAGAFDPRLHGRANFVRILHDDGTMALYAHLDGSGVAVRVGERVRRGQRIGLSGSTGYSAGPHLHFVVQANRGMRLESIPFRMFGPGGVLRFRDPGSNPRI